MRAGFFCLLLWPPALSGFALGVPLELLVPVFVAAGAGFGLFAVWWDTALSERIPAHTLSRVSSYDWLGSLGLLSPSVWRLAQLPNSAVPSSGVDA